MSEVSKVSNSYYSNLLDLKKAEKPKYQDILKQNGIGSVTTINFHTDANGDGKYNDGDIITVASDKAILSIYNIKPGDSIEKILKKQLESVKQSREANGLKPLTMAEAKKLLLKANPQAKANPDNLSPDGFLVIPQELLDPKGDNPGIDDRDAKTGKYVSPPPY